MIGFTAGVCAGYFGGKVDAVISFVIQVFSSFPFLLFAIVVMFAMGPGLVNLYVALGLVGVPIFAAGGGFGYIFNPTFGFLLGLIPTAWVIGKIAEKDRSVPRLLLACFAGLAVLYLVGLPYIALIVNVYKGGNVSGMTLATAYMLPYLPGDCLKIVVSVILAPRILKAMERNS